MSAKTPKDLLRETIKAHPLASEREIRAIVTKRLLAGERQLVHGVISDWLDRNYYPAAYRKGSATAGD